MTIEHVLGSDKVLRINHQNTLGLVQSFDWSPSFSAQDVYELGRTTKLDTAMELDVGGSFDLASAGNTAGMLARMRPTFDVNGNSNNWTFDSGGAPGLNAYTFTQDDLQFMQFDLIAHEKPNQRDFTRSLWMPHAYLNSFSGQIDAQGMATETYNFGAGTAYGFLNPYHDIISVLAVRTGNLTAQVVPAVATAAGVSAATHTIAYVNVNGRIFNSLPLGTNNPTQVASAAGSPIVITLGTNEGFVIPQGSHITACFYRTTPNTNWNTVINPQYLGASAPVYYVRGHMANVYLAPVTAGSPSSPEQWLRVQSLSYGVDLRVDTLKQVAWSGTGNSNYARVPTFPMDVSASITVNETDWADWRQVMTTAGGKTFAGTGNVALNTYEFAPQHLQGEFAIVVDYFTKNRTRIQNLQLLDMRLDGYGTRVGVGGRSEISWSLRGSEFRLEGFNP